MIRTDIFTAANTLAAGYAVVVRDERTGIARQPLTNQELTAMITHADFSFWSY